MLNGVTLLIFGAILLGPALGHLSLDLALYALLSLTVVRMVPVAIATVGTRARPPTIGFLGWFGPRGLASIVFAVIVLEDSQLPHEQIVLLAIYLTVGLSILLHGITAAPLADRYGRWYEAHPERPGRRWKQRRQPLPGLGEGQGRLRAQSRSDPASLGLWPLRRGRSS